jgi:hypothetical protein
MCLTHSLTLGASGTCDATNDATAECNVENISREKFTMLHNFLRGDMDHIARIS